MATADLSWLELAPSASADLSWLEFAPSASAYLSWLEFAAPAPTATADVSWLEFLPPSASASVSWLEFSAPPAPAIYTLTAEAGAYLMTWAGSVSQVVLEAEAGVYGVAGLDAAIGVSDPADPLVGGAFSFGGAGDSDDLDRAMMEHIKYREDQRVAMNNAVAISVMALLCEVLE